MDSGFITIYFEESLCHRGRSGFIAEIVLWSCGRESFSTHWVQWIIGGGLWLNFCLIHVRHHLQKFRICWCDETPSFKEKTDLTWKAKANSIPPADGHCSRSPQTESSEHIFLISSI